MEIQRDWTVNRTLRELPESARVFQRFGVDMCCGGELTLEQAARAAGLDPDSLLQALPTPEPTA